MILNFKQGIVTGNDKFVFNGTTVSIVTTPHLPLLLNFSHGDTNYIHKTITTIPDAWSGIPATCWLYFDIDLITSKFTYGFTTITPSFGTVFPSSPSLNQHFFNTITSKMSVWTGQYWVDVIRLFAGNIKSNIFYPESLSSQSNQNNECISGNILLDFKQKPIIVFNQDGTYHFLNDAIFDNFQHTNKSNFTFNGVKLNSIAEHNISSYKCVRWDQSNKMVTSSYLDQTPAVAMIQKNVITGEIIQLITKGFVVNPYWRWIYPPHTSLFLGLDGELVVNPLQTGSIQYIGYIVDPKTIFLNFDKQILINPT